MVGRMSRDRHSWHSGNREAKHRAAGPCYMSTGPANPQHDYTQRQVRRPDASTPPKQSLAATPQLNAVGGAYGNVDHAVVWQAGLGRTTMGAAGFMHTVSHVQDVVYLD
jgi:hypothetical protein